MSTTWFFSSRYGHGARPALQRCRHFRLGFAILAGLAVAGSANALPLSTADGFEPGLGAGEPVNAVAVQSDGKVLIGGQFTAVDGRPHVGVARVHAGGGYDETFAAETNGTVFALAVEPDGGILVGGAFNRIGGEPRTGLARLLPDGSVDADFDPEVAGPVFAIELQPDGAILIGGFFANVGGLRRSSLARLLPDGGVDTGFDPGYGVEGWVSALALQTDGAVVLGGHFAWVDGRSRTNLARVDGHGALDPLFAPRANGDVRAIRFAPDGKLLVGGDFTAIDGWWSLGLARLTHEGPVDPGFSMLPGAPNVRAIALESDGRIVIGGGFSEVNGFPRTGIARLQANGWIDLGSIGEVAADNAQPVEVRAVATAPDGRLVIGGAFTRVGERPRRNVARLNVDGTADADFEPRHGFQVEASLPLPDGKSLVRGFATAVGGKLITPLVRLNVDGTVDPRFLREIEGHLRGAMSLTVDGKMILFGYFPGFGPAPRQIVRLMPDGTLDAAFTGPSFNGMVWAIAALPDDRLLIGGDFTLAGGIRRRGLARLNADGTLDPGFDARLDGRANTVSVQSDGKILVGGQFSEVDGQARRGIARLHPDGALDESFRASTYFVDAFVVQPDGRILVVTNGDYLHRLEPDGQRDLTFELSWYFDSIETLGLQADGKLLVGGAVAAPSWTGHLSRYLSDGKLDRSFRVGPSSPVRMVSIQPDGRVLFGGLFGSVDGAERRQLARLLGQDPRTDVLTAHRNPMGTAITWRRAGAVQEVDWVTFEVATDDVGWTRLGPVARTPLGWELTGLDLPTDRNVYLRARGFYTTAWKNGSTSYVEKVVRVVLPAEVPSLGGEPDATE